MGKNALILIDMINTYEHPDAELLIPSVHTALPHIVRLLERARIKDVPVIYVNDNFGEWRSHHGEIVQAGDCKRNGVTPIMEDCTCDQ